MAETISERLEELRAALRAENISWGELAELQGLTEHIEPDDVELLEAAGVPEFPEYAESPHPGARVEVTPEAEGGITAKVIVPGYEGDCIFTISVERSSDGDWRVWIPWSPEERFEVQQVADSADPSRVYDCANGIVYIGSPEKEIAP